MNLIEAKHMSENFDNNLHRSFHEYKELLEEKDCSVSNIENNETVYPFTLYYLFKNVKLYLLKCMFTGFISILSFNTLIKYILQ
jgi:hypothetical protein